jgi:hypothetical protein
MRNQWVKLGGLLGIAYCIAGFVLIFLGWNGTASHDTETAQIPYIVSGGIAGLGLVVVGAALIVAHSLRTDRVELRAAIEDLRAGVERGAVAPAAAPPVAAEGVGIVAETAAVATGGDDVDTVIAGSDSYHRPACAVVAGQAEAVVMSRADATAAGLTACRVCNPDEAAA